MVMVMVIVIVVVIVIVIVIVTVIVIVVVIVMGARRSQHDAPRSVGAAKTGRLNSRNQIL